MGQYYRPIILKKDYKNRVNPIEASFNSWSYNNGAKLMEHSYIGNSFVRAVEEALAWQYKGCNFVWCGDYSDELVTKKYDGNLYDTAYSYHNKLDIQVTNVPPYRKYLINYTKRQYVKLNDVQKDKWQIHPLPLLCCNSNGRGGGDYHGTNMDKVGIWAYNRIGVADEIPNGFKELEVTFEEEY